MQRSYPRELPLLADWREARATDEEALFCPAMRGLPVGAASALAILPIHDANGEMIEAVASDALAPQRLCVGVMAVDPLRQWSRLFQRLRECGIGSLAVWPSVGVLGPDIQQGLAPHGMGVEREAAFVQEATDGGFRVTATAFSASQAARMAAAGASRILLHPPLPRHDENWLDEAMIDWLSIEAEKVRGLNVEVLLYAESVKPIRLNKLRFCFVRYGG